MIFFPLFWETIVDDDYYLLTNDTAIGTKWRHHMQSIIMEFIENPFLSSLSLKPTVYYRYIDDIFMIWAHGIDKLKQLFSNANNIHPNITFIYEASTALPFLNVLIEIYNTNTIYTTVYSRNTDKTAFIYYKSNHSIHLEDSSFFYFLRYKRICLDLRDFINCMKQLTRRF